MNNEEKVFLSYDQAVQLLPDGDDIHVFLNPNGMLLGADWSRESVLKLLKDGVCQLGGELCCKMDHGLVCEKEKRYHFVATRPQEQWSAELQLTTPQGQNAQSTTSPVA